MSSRRTDMAKVLGITGGIGSGKSYVCGVFRSLGCKVYDSDSRTKELYDENPGILEGLTKILGKGILKKGKLDRKAMATIIFGDRDLLEKVKDFVYPYVMEDFRQWKRRKRGTVIFESAVILENEYVRSFMDKTLVVTAPLRERIRRVMERDHSSEEEVRARLKSQTSDRKRKRLADFVLESVEGADIEKQARQILEQM
ncbi:MAG: dephospho-CoA kinase [Bacteroidales bacterium]|nr:dephospho-CoA kinase [Bacteroidales bacterium]